MFGWFKKKKVAQPVPEMGIRTHAVQLNPSNEAQLQRHRARIARLREAIASATTEERRASLQAELARREATLKAAGLE